MLCTSGCCRTSFQNSRLRDIAAEALDEAISWFTVCGWKWLHGQSRSEMPSSRLNGWFFCFQEAFNASQARALPFTDEIVQAAANMPQEHFHELQGELDPAFLSEVPRKFARRFYQRPLRARYSLMW